MNTENISQGKPGDERSESPGFLALRPRGLAALAPGLAALMLFAGAAGAGPGEKIKVTLVVILASEEGHFVDGRLKAIAEEVRKLNPNLTSFRLKEMTSRSLQASEKATFPLVDDKAARVVVKHGADADNRVEVAVTPPGQGELVYRTVCGKFLPIVTRCQTKAKERLILALRVQPCPGE